MLRKVLKGCGVVWILLICVSFAAVPVPTAGIKQKTLRNRFVESESEENSDEQNPVPLSFDIFQQFRPRVPFMVQHDDDSPLSCSNRCDTKGHDPELPCQCNSKCTKFGDCCSDYSDLCLSCSGRCDAPFDDEFPCQCNSKCRDFGDCCDDSYKECGGSAPVTDAELATFAEDILTNDVNNVASLVRVNLQGSSCFSCTKDAAPEQLLTVTDSAYRKPTIAKLLLLHNNYVASVGQPEVVSADESQEEVNFLDAILTTTIMKKAEKFLVDKGLLSTTRRMSNGNVQTNPRAFRDALHQIWFGLYTRENRILGSSGFEHVFLGEVKDGKVAGFHNWVFFSKEESNNRLNYKGRIGTAVNLGPKGRIIKHKFDWNNKEKPISSMFVGTSPEFEMALYTVCFYARPGARCPVKLNGKNVNIQTHYLNKQGKRYIGSAYPDI